MTDRHELRLTSSSRCAAVVSTVDSCETTGQQTKTNGMECLIAHAVGLISGKWKIDLLGHLNHGTIRHGKLCRLIPRVSTKVLTAQLRVLEHDGLIAREAFLEKVKRVEYSITPQERELWKRLEHLGRWAIASWDLEGQINMDHSIVGAGTPTVQFGNNVRPIGASIHARIAMFRGDGKGKSQHTPSTDRIESRDQLRDSSYTG